MFAAINADLMNVHVFELKTESTEKNVIALMCYNLESYVNVFELKTEKCDKHLFNITLTKIKHPVDYYYYYYTNN